MITAQGELEKMPDKYYWYKEHNICPKCRERPPEPGKSMCRECLNKANAKQKIRVKNGCNRKRYWKYKSHGLCVVCGGTLCVSSGIYCGWHMFQRDKIQGKIKPMDFYTGTDGTPLTVSGKRTENICNEDCFNCKYEDCIKP